MWFFKLLLASRRMGQGFRAVDAGRFELAVDRFDAAWRIAVDAQQSRSSVWREIAASWMTLLTEHYYDCCYAALGRRVAVLDRIREAKHHVERACAADSRFEEQENIRQWRRWADGMLAASWANDRGSTGSGPSGVQ